MHAHNFQKFVVTQDLLEDEGKKMEGSSYKVGCDIQLTMCLKKTGI